MGGRGSPTFLRYAKEADAESRYELADAAALPFADGSIDLVIAYNSLMDVADMPAAIREAARVLQPGGQFCICVTHPLNDAGALSGGPRARNPLEDYCRALREAGLVIARLREPIPGDQAVNQEPALERRRRIPVFLQLAAVKP